MEMHDPLIFEIMNWLVEQATGAREDVAAAA
jgi:hypothetical protein